MGKMAPRPSWMVKNGKKKGLGWPGNGLKLLEIDSEWSQVGQLNGQELGKDAIFKMARINDKNVT